MAQPKDPKDGHVVRPRTAVLTRGFDPRLSVGSARPAVFRSSTYVFSSPESAERAFDVATGRAQPAEGEDVELIYSRISHPNAQILEEQVVPLELGASSALVFNSGMAAIMTAFMTFLRPGDTIVYTIPLYGGTNHLIQEFLSSLGITGIRVPAGHGAELERAIREADNLGAVFIETPANPTMTMTDIHRAAAVAGSRARKPLIMVDNTFLGPAFQHPLTLGADLVLYSATKYLSGFSDMLAGIALARDPELIAAMRKFRLVFGNILQPDECWMMDGRLPTVSLRMNRQSKNAQRIAERIVRHPSVRKVLYPTLFDDAEQIRIRLAQCDFPGGLFSLELGSKQAAFTFLRNVKIARNAVSLGGVETLACHPKTTTHSGLSEEEYALSGITDGLVRISVGIEDWRDLLSDFERALDTIPAELRQDAGTKVKA
ncbi:MAG TPA: aminotransferase class I/II-fold pyridoxal phosphate-dependent enzyme [Bryobacteraceae bacterium]|nr:aminotransferase class I/II-fold pyridoxal phosphate-dependent enzyme [Bryobacteraceae bacterium]